MRKPMRILLAGLAVLCLTFSGCANLLWTVMDAASSTEKTFEQVKKLFEADQDAVLAAVRSGQYEDAASLDWIESVDDCGTYVYFACGGSGMGSQTNYSGFFYTPEDDPLVMHRHSNPAMYALNAEDFVQTEEGWEYRESASDNHFIIRRLATGYYYYWEHF